jgi:hypothetical protein
MVIVYGAKYRAHWMVTFDPACGIDSGPIVNTLLICLDNGGGAKD